MRIPHTTSINPYHGTSECFKDAWHDVFKRYTGTSSVDRDSLPLRLLKAAAIRGAVMRIPHTTSITPYHGTSECFKDAWHDVFKGYTGTSSVDRDSLPLRLLKAAVMRGAVMRIPHTTSINPITQKEMLYDFVLS